MESRHTETTVMGKKFETWADYDMKGMYAKDEETGEAKMIKGSGYLSKDLSIRKAIANVFGLESFRK